MADAPSGGGGLTGAEIILIAVLVIGTIATLSGNPIKTYAPAPVTTTPVATTPAAPTCGITLTRPVKSEKISSVVTVTGTITPCDNALTQISSRPNPSITLTGQIVDKNGTPMSALTPISVNVISATSGSFDADLPITGAPAAGTGYAIITGPIQNDGTSLVARQPITFK
jgi:hypothetical protein